jgi:NADPH-dependent stearoyl-CoA 9-desaturase
MVSHSLVYHLLLSMEVTMSSREISHEKTQPLDLPSKERMKQFGAEIELLRKRVESELGEDDVRYIRRLNRFSRTMEAAGRILIHASFEPIGFGAGVTALWIHKQLQTTEIGHTVLHGAYDRLEGAEGFHSKSFQWDMPIDEESWRRGHNLAHHQFTNIAGKDPDIHFGFVRLTEHTPHRWSNRVQLPFTVLAAFPNFAFMMNMHFTGMIDLYSGNGREEKFDYISDRSMSTVVDVHKRAFRKYLPYYFKNYVFYPALAGPFFFKVLAGNWLAETMRDVYTAATIYCGHVGEDVSDYPTGSRAQGKGHWYAMQAEASNNFRVPHVLSVLCGGLDMQIEHHMFPRLPPHRLRQISPEVEQVCKKYGVQYRKESWPGTLGKALKRIARLSNKSPAPLGKMKRVFAGMM